MKEKSSLNVIFVICTNFGQNGTLKKHVTTIHKRRKHFKCDICNAEFTSKDSMKGHIATIHLGKKQFKCEICNAKFGHKSNLVKHLLQQFMMEGKISNVVYVLLNLHQSIV